MFAYEGERLPTLKALDRTGSVVYIGSFSKTLFPALRIGYLVADQSVEGSPHTLARELSRVKALTTVNTSTVLQALVAEVLERHGSSLRGLVQPKVNRLRRNRDLMLECLEDRFGGGRSGVQWNCPEGGFFLTLDLPGDFGAAELEECVARYGVIVCPMSFFR